MLGRANLPLELRLARWDAAVVCAAPHPISGSEGAVARRLGARQSPLPGAARFVPIGLLIVRSSKQGRDVSLVLCPERSRPSRVSREGSMEISLDLYPQRNRGCSATDGGTLPERIGRCFSTYFWGKVKVGLGGGYLLRNTSSRSGLQAPWYPRSHRPLSSKTRR